MTMDNGDHNRTGWNSQNTEMQRITSIPHQYWMQFLLHQLLMQRCAGQISEMVSVSYILLRRYQLPINQEYV